MTHLGLSDYVQGAAWVVAFRIREKIAYGLEGSSPSLHFSLDKFSKHGIINYRLPAVNPPILSTSH